MDDLVAKCVVCGDDVEPRCLAHLGDYRTRMVNAFPGSDVLAAAKFALDAEHDPLGIQPTTAELRDLVWRLANELAHERQLTKSTDPCTVDQ